VWLIVVLAGVMELALMDVFDTYVSASNCPSGDAAVCLETLFYLDH
jgi:hypothetical protein